MKNLQAQFYLTVIIVIYLMGAVHIDLLDNDATQYMTIARNMHLSGDYMTVEWRSDYNYLDKPPLLFWLSAFFFSFHGIIILLRRICTYDSRDLLWESQEQDHQFSARSSKCAWGCAHAGQTFSASSPSYIYPQLRQRHVTFLSFMNTVPASTFFSKHR